MKVTIAIDDLFDAAAADANADVRQTMLESHSRYVRGKRRRYSFNGGTLPHRWMTEIREIKRWSAARFF